MRRRFFRRVRSAIVFPASGSYGGERPRLAHRTSSCPVRSPALDERERGGQNREGYGRLQEPGTTPDALVSAPPGLRQYTTHQAQSFGPGRATFVLRGFGAFPAPRDSRARGRRKFMTAPVKERGTRRNHARFGQIYLQFLSRPPFAEPSAQPAAIRSCNTRRPTNIGQMLRACARYPCRARAARAPRHRTRLSRSPLSLTQAISWKRQKAVFLNGGHQSHRSAVSGGVFGVYCRWLSGCSSSWQVLHNVSSCRAPVSGSNTLKARSGRSRRCLT